MVNFDEKEYQAVILGALLHDVGKFVQRSQENPKSQDHQHWGDEWFQNNLAEKLSPLFAEEEKQIIRTAISNHHEHERYISLADAISAGMDRIKLDSEEVGDPFSARLISIFSKISISESAKKEKYHKLSPLGSENLKEAFPIDDKECSFKDYKKLLEDFEKQIKSLDFKGLTRQKIIESLYFLLWKYTWCVPSAAYKDEPDVSLFDHLKTTAAIAGCLYAYHKENPEKTLNVEMQAFCLIGGDISGIQNYIFEVLTQQGKVAKRLRARSLFVQLISEIASHKILHAFNLPLCNLIGAAGGNFYILAPNLKETNSRVTEFQREFDNWTLTNLKTELNISLAIVDACGKDLTDFSKLLDGILKPELTLKKYQPHKSVLCTNDKWLINGFVRPEVIEGDERVCQGCRKNSQSEEQNEDNLCDRCLTDTKMGQSLPKAKYIAFFADAFHEFHILNHSFELWDEGDFIRKPTTDPYLILSLNKPEIKTPCTGFKYLATHIPINEEEKRPRTFDEIAGNSQGDKLLGYLKADVDNLGKILREGFKWTKPSISRYSTFSQMLEIFFAGYLNTKLESDFADIYTVFSGGDDFFLVGPWNQTIDFAYLMRKEFSRFCAGNPDMKFSSGLTVSKPHDPIAHCAREAEVSLGSSKNSKNEEKNRITLFGQTLTWPELSAILREARRIIEWLKKEPPLISRGFAYNLRSYGAMYQEYEETGETKWLKFVPLLNYDINRNLAKKEQEEAYEWAINLSPTIRKDEKEDNLPYLKTIMEYVLTYTRS